MKFEVLVDVIQNTHQHFQTQANKAVNISLTLRNWMIGFYIVEFEQKGEDRAEYGSKLLSKLAENSKHIKGLDERSFRNFRFFYKQYPQIQSYILNHFPKLSIWWSPTTELDFKAKSDRMAIRGSVTAESDTTNILVPVEKILNHLSYTHLELLCTMEDLLKRTFYEIECIKGTWSVRELKRQINSLYYERSGMSLKPEKLAEITSLQAETIQPTDIVKSVYAFEFLGLKIKDAVEESDLETALLDNLQQFMLEMGHGFCLEARQKKILIGDDYFFIDLVFYHRILKCHVLLELKIEAFNHHNIGQLNTYVNYYKSQIMQPSDNPTIGILLVTDKNHTLVEYATAGMDNQLFVSKYMLELPQKEQLEAFVKSEIEKFNK
jgi:predicted nuclease of restriction endonuclease-like (RecB) superfamily